jgi:peptidyl-prolyl cis-trans isomerase D
MNRIKVKEFEKERRDEIINEKFMQIVTGSLVIGEETLREDYKAEKDKVNLDFVVLRPDRIKEKIEVTDEELKSYFDNHKEDFKTAEKRRGSAIVYKFDDFKKDINISDKDLFDYYRENKDSFFVPGKTKVSRIFLKYDETNREDILKKAEELEKELTPENFAQKAGEVSQDAKAKQGGDYGYQDWQSFSEQEKTIIEGLEEKRISTPIDTRQGGFSLIFISEKVEKHQEPFDKVKDRIKENFEDTQLNKIVQNKIGKAYNKLKGVKDIKSKSEDFDVKIIETGDLKNGDPIKEVDEAGYISRALFTLEEGEVSMPIEFMQGMAIVQLTGIIKPENEPFENVKDQVKNRAEMAKKIESLEKDSQNVTAKLNALSDEKEIEKYLKDEKLSSTAFEYKRGNKLSYLPEKKDLDEIIFALAEGRFSSPIKFENQVAIVKVKSKTITDDTDFEKEKTGFYNQKLNDLKMNFFASFVSQARGKYKIEKFNQKLFQEIQEQIMTKFNE